MPCGRFGGACAPFAPLGSGTAVAMPYAQKEIISQIEQFLVILSSKTYVFEVKLTK